MKKLLIIFLALANNIVIAQKENLCDGPTIDGVKASLYINGYKQVEVVKKSNKGSCFWFERHFL